MKILVTGGAGFIGSHIADAFLKRGHSVDILDNLSTGREENIPAEARFYKHSINDDEVAKILKNRYDAICHYAAQIDVRKSVRDPVGDLRDDIIGSVNLFRFAVQNGVGKFVFASSGGAIYGEQEQFPANEDHPINPASPYGLHKWMVEKYLHYFHTTADIKYTALRYANIYGPRQNSASEAGVISIFSEKLLSGSETLIFGNGEQTRDFVFVDDAVNAAVKAVEKEYCGCLNIGTGIETTINDIFDVLKKEINSGQQRLYAPAKQGEQFRSVLDSKSAEKLLGWVPEIALREGLKRTVDYFRKRVSV